MSVGPKHLDDKSKKYMKSQEQYKTTLLDNNKSYENENLKKIMCTLDVRCRVLKAYVERISCEALGS